MSSKKNTQQSDRDSKFLWGNDDALPSSKEEEMRAFFGGFDAEEECGFASIEEILKGYKPKPLSDYDLKGVSMQAAREKYESFVKGESTTAENVVVENAIAVVSEEILDTIRESLSVEKNFPIGEDSKDVVMDLTNITCLLAPREHFTGANDEVVIAREKYFRAKDFTKNQWGVHLIHLSDTWCVRNNFLTRQGVDLIYPNGWNRSRLQKRCQSFLQFLISPLSQMLTGERSQTWNFLQGEIQAALGVWIIPIQARKYEKEIAFKKSISTSWYALTALWGRAGHTPDSLPLAVKQGTFGNRTWFNVDNPKTLQRSVVGLFMEGNRLQEDLTPRDYLITIMNFHSWMKTWLPKVKNLCEECPFSFCRSDKPDRLTNSFETPYVAGVDRSENDAFNYLETPTRGDIVRKIFFGFYPTSFFEKISHLRWDDWNYDYYD